jgi:hypothetical protein
MIEKGSSTTHGLQVFKSILICLSPMAEPEKDIGAKSSMME